jgi:hypothetical protein
MNFKTMVLVGFAALAPSVASAQRVEIGPGGFRIDEGRGGYDRDRGYDDRGRGDYDRGRGGYGRERGGGETCARENEFCQFRGEANVRYGARGSYVVRRARDGIPCNNRVFGDPAPGIPKRCVID